MKKVCWVAAAILYGAAMFFLGELAVPRGYVLVRAGAQISNVSFMNTPVIVVGLDTALTNDDFEQDLPWWAPAGYDEAILYRPDAANPK